jgi:hypothetical protein
MGALVTLDWPGIMNNVVAGLVLSAVLAVIGATVAFAKAKSLARGLVDRAADRLPESVREEYREEWQAAVYFGSRRTAIRFAVSIWRGVGEVSTAATAAEESKLSNAQPPKRSQKIVVELLVLSCLYFVAALGGFWSFEHYKSRLALEFAGSSILLGGAALVFLWRVGKTFRSLLRAHRARE